MLGAGAAVDQADNDGWTPLSIASQSGHTEAVTALLGAGVAVNQANNNGWTPLIAASSRGHTKAVAKLLAHSADSAVATTQRDAGVPMGSTARSAAQLKGHSEVAALLL